MDRVEFRQKLRAKGMTIAGWCRVNKFSPASVNTWLSGKWGTLASTERAGAVSGGFYRQAIEDGLL